MRYKTMKRYQLSLLIGFLLVADVSLAGNIQRSCRAYYELERTSATYPKPVPPPLGPERLTFQFGDFGSHGSCGKSVPNRCRERARNAAHQCMRSHWANPARSEGWVCADSAISNYQLPRPYLRGEVQDWICRSFRVSSMSVRVKAVTTGDTGCDQTAVLQENFSVNCER